MAKKSDLSKYALTKLQEIAAVSIPEHEVNPGCRHRLYRDDLVQQVMKPSPYKTHKGKLIPFLIITAAGKRLLED